ncbi:Intradiol ring-cleavage dioxygenase [Chaetomidium leptoderma]|uniref:Intradiol ring-cleavage dioxygenase n=1 Tax=Chaetomidium leptoderma TaxID=669021 RepID=A0AAN6VCC1_9PEZI|nr:Intradiol ring-cleavage dioxygenase [Chaetomidium leptoderma]
MLFTKAVSVLSLFTGLTAAHPGHDVAQEAAERRDYLQSAKRTSLAHCAGKLRARGTEARNVARRQAVIEKARQKRGLKKREIDTVLNTDHDKTELGYTRDTDPATLFAGYNSCLLTPEVTEGPYYVAGEYVRENVVEDQPGVPLLLDYQVIDIATCEPVPDVYVEIWHCNATGVPTDADGVAQFESVFPGHYTGRTTHIHIAVHANATLLPNQTLGLDTYASHVGQSFFDQKLISEVEKLAPYESNAQPLTTNVDDFIMAQEAATEGVDPVMEYTLLGETVEEGLFAWIAFGVDSSRSKPVRPAVYLQEEGGVVNPSGGIGGPGGFPSGFPTGFPGGFSTRKRTAPS